MRALAQHIERTRRALACSHGRRIGFRNNGRRQRTHLAGPGRLLSGRTCVAAAVEGRSVCRTHAYHRSFPSWGFGFASHVVLPGVGPAKPWVVTADMQLHAHGVEGRDATPPANTASDTADYHVAAMVSVRAGCRGEVRRSDTGTPRVCFDRVG